MARSVFIALAVFALAYSAFAEEEVINKVLFNFGYLYLIQNVTSTRAKRQCCNQMTSSCCGNSQPQFVVQQNSCSSCQSSCQSSCPTCNCQQQCAPVCAQPVMVQQSCQQQCTNQCTSQCSTPSCVQSCQPTCQQACGNSQPIVIMAQQGSNCQSSCSNQCSSACSTPACVSSCNNQCSVCSNC